ncbi:MAG: FRG domain-containing protein [Burkholderiales bacterium]
MAWPTIEIDSWQRFSSIADRLIFARPHDAPYVMRGQADEAWALSPSLLRLFPANVTAADALAVERISLEEFRAQAHLHLSAAVLPNSFPQPALPEWWALMQHHHAPTRLLDWTRSPYVAAYFAIEQEPEKAGAVFVVHSPTASRAFAEAFSGAGVNNDQLKDPQASQALLFWEPLKKSDRFVAQQGYFSFSVNVLGAHDRLIAEQCEEAKRKASQKMFFEKWIIPPNLKLEFLRKLRAMNIAAHSLFPGIDGLGRSLGEVAKLATVVRFDAV